MTEPLKFVKIEHPDAPPHLAGVKGRYLRPCAGRAEIYCTSGETIVVPRDWLVPVERKAAP